ncbi:MAG: chitobiase/beta-hexosaminidase C-terminal domain-containing protein [Candidatus Cloacimonetes bacterium]|nr:chitobiase/beta-hexosaminidase C-terminal domain-containing protein [Candidatus Cloacimonadota bacterium]
MNKKLVLVFLIFKFIILLYSTQFTPIETEKSESSVRIYLNSIKFNQKNINNNDEIAIFLNSLSEENHSILKKNEEYSNNIQICLSNIIYNDSTKDKLFFLINKSFLKAYKNNLSTEKKLILNSDIHFKYYNNKLNQIFEDNQNNNDIIIYKLFESNNKIFIDIFINMQIKQVQPVQFLQLSNILSPNTELKLITETKNADIYYTIDGSIPSINSTIYKNLFYISPQTDTLTINAIAFKDNFLPSEITSLKIFNQRQKLPAPLLNIPSGTYLYKLKLKPSHIDYDANIYYTTNGEEPTQDKAKIINQDDYIEINNDTNLKLKAYKDGFIPSETVEYDFIIHDNTHFNKDYLYSNADFTNIIISEINISDYQYNINDEIAIFDDNICTGIIKSSGDNSLPLTLKTFKNNNFNIDSDYNSANSILVKIWDASNNKEFIENIDFKTEYTLEQGVFDNTETLYLKLSNISQIEAPVFSYQSGIYNSPIELSISHYDENTIIYYAIEEPSQELFFYEYNEPIFIPQGINLNIYAKACKNGLLESDLVNVSIEISGKIPSPMIFPDSGIYQEFVEISLNSDYEDSIIYYTIDGSEPDSTKLFYEEPFTLLENTIVNAIAYCPNYTESEIITQEYFILNKPNNLSTIAHIDQAILTWEAPNINNENILAYKIYKSLYPNNNFLEIAEIPPAIYTYTDSLLISGIYEYKISTLYEEGESDFSNSTQVQINQVSPPLFSPTAGYHTEPISINIFTVTDSASIFYTIDGSNPDLNSLPFTEILEIQQDSTIVIKAIAYRNNFKESQISTGVFTVTGKLKTPIANFENNAYYEPILINITSLNSNTQIRYTVDNTEPNSNSNLYNEPFLITNSCNLKIKEFKENWIESDTKDYEYLIVNMPDNFNITSIQDSTIINWDEPLMISNIEYNPDNISLLGYHLFRKSYAENEFIQLNEELITINSYTDRNLLPGTYSYYILIVYDVYSLLSQIVTTDIYKTNNPTFNLTPNYYYSPISVELLNESENISIHYTLDGSDPNEESPIYSSARPININLHTTLTIKARAYSENNIPSDIIQGTYIVTGKVSNPTFSHTTSEFEEEFYLSIINNDDAIIYYTLDGSQPNTSNTGISTSHIYTNPIKINKTTTVKALATKPQWANSDIVSMQYEFINSQSEVIEPLFTTKLSNAYPNPFNNKTNIPFTLDKQTIVEIEIYNLLGQKIITLISESKSKGQHQVNWNGRDENGREVAGGVYFCRMKTPQYNQMIKLVYVK